MFAYRIVWAAFMVLVFAPAFMLASSVEGISYNESVWWMAEQMNDYFSFPVWLADIVSYPAALIAAVLPGTSSLAIIPGEMFLEHLGRILVFLFFLLVRPPFYVVENASQAD